MQFLQLLFAFLIRIFFLSFVLLSYPILMGQE